MVNKKAQVWIETVLYTIVGLSIIGIVLGFAMPKINQSKDNIAVEQSISAMKTLDSQIREVARSSGMRLIPEFKIKRGFLNINGTDDSIYLTINDLGSLYSENNVSYNEGNVKVISLKGAKKNSVVISLNYSSNITYDGIDQNKLIAPASTSYKIIIENKGSNIDFKIS